MMNAEFISTMEAYLWLFLPGKFYFERKHIRKIEIKEFTSITIAELDGVVRNPITDSEVVPVMIIEVTVNNDYEERVETIYCDMLPNIKRIVGKWEQKN